MNGRMLLEGQTNTINISHLPQGMYILKTGTQRKKFNLRFHIQLNLGSAFSQSCQLFKEFLFFFTQSFGNDNVDGNI